ncbi:MAG: macro domain-containing protein [Xenococcaceae cyanobacterium]
MKVIKGDLIKLALEGKFDVIVHGCNCFCAMGAGIAKAIKKEFPEAYQADCMTEKGDRGKLGSITFAEVERNGKTIVIVNGYTQYHWRGRGVLVNYDALKKVFSEVKKRFAGKPIGYPKIGAGFAGGDWERISKIIDFELEGEDRTLVEFTH